VCGDHQSQGSLPDVSFIAHRLSYGKAIAAF
jgi:hypothetical protein